MQPLALLVNPKLPVTTLKEFVDYAKARPGQINYGSAGNGGISHLAPEMFKAATGLFMVHIPYRGSAPAFTDLMGGQVQFMAESSRERNPALPDVRNRMITQGADPAFLGADEFAKYLANEMPRWADAVGKSGAKLD